MSMDQETKFYKYTTLPNSLLEHYSLLIRALTNTNPHSFTTPTALLQTRRQRLPLPLVVVHSSFIHSFIHSYIHHPFTHSGVRLAARLLSFTNSSNALTTKHSSLVRLFIVSGTHRVRRGRYRYYYNCSYYTSFHCLEYPPNIQQPTPTPTLHTCKLPPYAAAPSSIHRGLQHSSSRLFSVSPDLTL